MPEIEIFVLPWKYVFFAFNGKISLTMKVIIKELFKKQISKENGGRALSFTFSSVRYLEKKKLNLLKSNKGAKVAAVPV